MHYSLASFTSTLYNTPLFLLTGIQRLSNLHSYLCLMKVTWTLKKTYALKILLVSKALLDSICKIHCSAMKGLSYYNILGGKHSQLCHYLQLNPWSFHTVEWYFVFQRMQYLPFHFLLIPFIFILFVHLALLIHVPAGLLLLFAVLCSSSQWRGMESPHLLAFWMFLPTPLRISL